MTQKQHMYSVDLLHCSEERCFASMFTVSSSFNASLSSHSVQRKYLSKLCVLEGNRRFLFT